MRLLTISKLLLLLSFVFFSTTAPSYAQIESETVQGSLRNISPRLLNGSPYQRVEFMGEAGQQLTIDVSSSDFDAYLILKDSNGNVIAEDNNSGSNRQDAHLTVPIPSDGRYEVWVTTYRSSGRGRYTITIAELDPNVELVPSSAVAQQTTVFDADYLSGTWFFEGGNCDVRSLDFKESGSVDIIENGSLSDSTSYYIVENGYHMADLGDNPHGEGSFYEVISVEQNEYRVLIHTDPRGGNPEGPYRVTRCTK